jgi:hypothetical protein
MIIADPPKPREIKRRMSPPPVMYKIPILGYWDIRGLA